ncbi:M15 family metallopeptidase [Aestuariicella sp. G3-2]|uniref:M15 family metallopeptidase n=1 Tax=Pseudomaricurvus albidus TaxID=2842452 RepID=UPI001C0B7EC8|nr:M15 family metallopeptidase [Aestuariicella albida]MBU3069055.1 M15 family metallopeptidase [Aestuariicella albida]
MRNESSPLSGELFAELTGQTESHLVSCNSRESEHGAQVLIHADALKPFLRLRDKARQAGFELAIASSFRGFDRQQHIWQQKAAGKRPVFGVDGKPLDPRALSDEQLLWAILRWSALPGASRHHWGSDLDVYDAAAVDDDYRLQLVPEEYAPSGPFGLFRQWLDTLIEEGEAEGFFHPYARDLGAVAPEPWHISYRPVAQRYQALFDAEVFQQLLASGAWPLSGEIQRHADDIYRRYVQLEPA